MRETNERQKQEQAGETNQGRTVNHCGGERTKGGSVKQDEIHEGTTTKNKTGSELQAKKDKTGSKSILLR